MSANLKESRTAQQELRKSEATILELRRIIDKMKRDNEHLRLELERKRQMNGNLSFRESQVPQGARA